MIFDAACCENERKEKFNDPTIPAMLSRSLYCVPNLFRRDLIIRLRNIHSKKTQRKKTPANQHGSNDNFCICVFIQPSALCVGRASSISSPFPPTLPLCFVLHPYQKPHPELALPSCTYARITPAVPFLLISSPSPSLFPRKTKEADSRPEEEQASKREGKKEEQARHVPCIVPCPLPRARKSAQNQPAVFSLCALLSM